MPSLRLPNSPQLALLHDLRGVAIGLRRRRVLAASAGAGGLRGSKDRTVEGIPLAILPRITDN